MKDEKLIEVRPSKRQIEIQSLGFYAFFHFTINTFTGKEWGDGQESPSLFNPEEMDADQWVRAIKAAGMKGAILTCKHHDGFCLWPSKYTEHSVKASPYKNGQGDIVREVSDACKRQGIKFGVYLSPWDRNQGTYGQGKAYNDYFVNQLTELLTQYGEVFCVWFDGACGEGKNGKKQDYDWERYYKTIRKYQPDACISVTGPDVRWCGNEAGDTRESEWSVVPAAMSVAEKIAEASQQEDNTAFREKTISSMEQDLGSRARLKNEEKLIWYPAEVDVSIRPGWFYHEEEDTQVRSLENLVDIYEKSVGGNATLLLNIPPMPNGKLNEADVARLEELGTFLQKKYEKNLGEDARIYVEEDQESILADELKEDDFRICYKGKNPQIKVTVMWDVPVDVSAIVLKENISFSQRVEKYKVFVWGEKGPDLVYEGTTVGFCKIISIKRRKTNAVIVEIDDSRVAPVLSYVGVY